MPQYQSRKFVDGVQIICALKDFIFSLLHKDNCILSRKNIAIYLQLHLCITDWFCQSSASVIGSSAY